MEDGPHPFKGTEMSKSDRFERLLLFLDASPQMRRRMRIAADRQDRSAQFPIQTQDALIRQQAV